jgi:myo-inositol 2-dehydrogenase / D-chiro-inositol 1-dehydrogenase
MAKLNVGLIGVGRLGRVYAHDLSTRIASTRLATVADVDEAALDAVRREFDIPRVYRC